jgi:hypothetical protein
MTRRTLARLRAHLDRRRAYRAYRPRHSAGTRPAAWTPLTWSPLDDGPTLPVTCTLTGEHPLILAAPDEAPA